jgi:hypothetical protein
MFIGPGCSISLLLYYWLIIIQCFYVYNIINKNIQLLKLNTFVLSLFTNMIFWNRHLKCFILGKFLGGGSATDKFNLHYFKWGNLTRKSNYLLERIVFEVWGSTVIQCHIMHKCSCRSHLFKFIICTFSEIWFQDVPQMLQYTRINHSEISIVWSSVALITARLPR